jgi:membrane protein DedA with SNARE-associated domain
MQNTMLRYGPGYIFAVRFMPGMRTALFFAAGSLKMPYRYMLLYDGAAALVELPLLVYAVRYVGGRWQEILAVIQRFQGFVLPAIVVLVIGIWLYSRRGSSNGR